jgi:hypothetical protein
MNGFGVDPKESQHHFVVSISKAEDGEVWISEHLSFPEHGWGEKIRDVESTADERTRVGLSRRKWDGIPDAVSDEFNRRLRNSKIRTGKWKEPGLTPVCVTFGKELVLLAWAVEDADPGKIPTAIANWKGLTPEERWWLFTMTNAATGQALRGKNVGWRKAVRFALTENPLSPTIAEQRVGLIADLDKVQRKSEEKKRRKPQGVTLGNFVHEAEEHDIVH